MTAALVVYLVPVVLVGAVAWLVPAARWPGALLSAALMFLALGPLFRVLVFAALAGAAVMLFRAIRRMPNFYSPEDDEPAPTTLTATVTVLPSTMLPAADRPAVEPAPIRKELPRG